MNNFVIITESTCDSTYTILKKSGIAYAIPMNFSIGGINYLDYPDHKTLPIEEFYRRLRKKAPGLTSALNPHDISDICIPYLQKGISVLYLTLSSGLSNTYQNALLAAEELNEKYKAKLRVVDSKIGSMGQSLLGYYCSERRKLGMSLEQVAVWAEENVKYLSAVFTVNDLFFLKRGGRVSSTTAILGSALSIKPILNCNNEGKLVNIAKIRGRKNSLNDIANRVIRRRVKQVNEKIYIAHADCYEDAIYVRDQIKKHTDLKDANFEINHIGPTMAIHCGPDTVAVFSMSTQR